MTARVVWSAQAEEDLRGIAHFIGVERHSPQAAAALIDRMVAACDLRATQPRSGQHRPELAAELRSFPLGNYVVFYFPITDGIHVIRILHGAQDSPAYFPS